jgi:hypothetical protein
MRDSHVCRINATAGYSVLDFPIYITPYVPIIGPIPNEGRDRSLTSTIPRETPRFASIVVILCDGLAYLW